MATTGARPKQSVTARVLYLNLKALAAFGLTKGEPRETTIARMVAYIKFVRPKATNAESLAASAYDAVKNKPTSTWGELIKNPIASWQEGIGNVVAPFKSVAEAVGAIFSAITSGALWLRVLLALGGVALLWIGLNLLLKQLAKG